MWKILSSQSCVEGVDNEAKYIHLENELSSLYDF